MSDNDHPFPILWNAIIYCVKQSHLNDVIQRTQCNQYLVKICPVAVKNSPHILKHPDIRLETFDR